MAKAAHFLKKLIAVSLLVGAPAWADEQMQPLALDGNWIALAHKPDMVANADVCAMANPTSGVIFRFGESVLELRVRNEKWELPADVKGKVVLSVGSLKKEFEIAANQNDSVSSLLSEDDINTIFSEMDKNKSMTIEACHDKPFIVSLAGSRKVGNAFKTCAGIHSQKSDAAANPFQ